MMSSPAAELEQVVRSGLGADQVVVIDFSGGCSGAKLEVYLSSPRFAGLSTLARHRLVNDAVKAAGMFDDHNNDTPLIHALTIKAWTPEEWDRKKHTIPNTAPA